MRGSARHCGAIGETLSGGRSAGTTKFGDRILPQQRRAPNQKIRTRRARAGAYGYVAPGLTGDTGVEPANRLNLYRKRKLQKAQLHPPERRQLGKAGFRVSG